MVADESLRGVWGSSPRVRGLRLRPRSLRPPRRIIPARAGFTVRVRGHPRPPTDHPRACGVYDAEHVWQLTKAGSSPRVRGLPACVIGVTWPPRIIPARAGFTRWASMTVMSPAGSSPRVRGLRASSWWPGSRPGIIPARAGFTPSASAPRTGATDHPRACGVYPEGMDIGSEYERIIPARAGFTTETLENQPKTTDHPRACGVYHVHPSALVPPQGSSPRVRGLLSDYLSGKVIWRIIPARAGFTGTRPGKA